LNPGLLNFETLVGTPESRCVQRVLRLDRLYASSTDVQADYVANLGAIDSASCPEDFQDTFDDYIEAWEQLDAIDARPADAEPSLLDRASALLGLTATRDEALEDIEAAWAEVERVALGHGVTAPPK
jgi:hypothetical protein